MKTGTKVKGTITVIAEDGITFTYDELCDGFVPLRVFEQNGIDYRKMRVGGKIEVFATKEIVNGRLIISFVHVTNSGRLIRSAAAKQPKNPPPSEDESPSRNEIVHIKKQPLEKKQSM